MRNKITIKGNENVSYGGLRHRSSSNRNRMHIAYSEGKLPEILVITSYPPRECGLATYSEDLIRALNDKFNRTFNIKICPLESDNEKHTYPSEIKEVLNIDVPDAFSNLAKTINENTSIRMVMIQHEFGLFAKRENEFEQFLKAVTKPVILVFHTVLPRPNDELKARVREFVASSTSIIVMTNTSAKILINDYSIAAEKITVIPHGTHLVKHADKETLKKKYKAEGRKVLSTFGLLSSGKSIETTLEAMPAIIKEHPDVLFLIIGKTHPAVIKSEGSRYRDMLDAMITKLGLKEHVRYVNYYLPLPELLEYLQLTDVYLFTSKDPDQAVSGTFSYALSCGCPIVSTPIPHVLEVLGNDTGIIIDFGNSKQLGEAVSRLLGDETLRKNIASNALHKVAPTAWENTAIAHARLFEKIGGDSLALKYTVPPVNLDHIKKLTTDFGMIQFSKIDQPDIASGYTLDDNARALIAMCEHFEFTRERADLKYINIYFNFIKYCLQSKGYFLNYVNAKKEFTDQNNSSNLADANGRAIWALGYLISVSLLFPKEARGLGKEAEAMMQSTLHNLNKMHSTRAMAFVIKGLYYRNLNNNTIENVELIRHLADRLVQMYRHESTDEWGWYESYLTYANSVLPEAMLCAWLTSGELVYKDVAKTSFDFLLSKIFGENKIKVISNKGWLHKEGHVMQEDGTWNIRHAASDTIHPLSMVGGEQPIDVAYTIIALSKFYEAFKEERYEQMMEGAFNWFLGSNHLHRIIYNPCTGGCFDGLEEHDANLNQGAESTLSYLMAKLTMDIAMRDAKARSVKQKIMEKQKEDHVRSNRQDEFVKAHNS